MAAKKKSAGGSLTRSQVVTVRLDPKLKFAAELAARKQRRTISSFIEWAVGEAVSRVELTGNININNVMNQVWDVEEADRFVKLALNYPDLLTYEEEKLWKIIVEHQPFWQGKNGDKKYDGVNEASVFWHGIRKYWEILQKVAAGDATSDDLSGPTF